MFASVSPSLCLFVREHGYAKSLSAIFVKSRCGKNSLSFGVDTQNV